MSKLLFSCLRAKDYVKEAYIKKIQKTQKKSARMTGNTEMFGGLFNNMKGWAEVGYAFA